VVIVVVVPPSPTALDGILPDSAWSNAFSTVVAAPPRAVWDALHRVTRAEMSVTRALVALRAAPARLLRRPGHLGAGDPGAPLLEQFLRSGFSVLHEDAPSSLAAGAIGRPWRPAGDDASVAVPDLRTFAAFSEPGYVRMALAFDLDATDEGTRLRTETRVAPTDPGAARIFRRYWLVIRPGSALIRLDLLHAIRRRAERAS
jgi:hypothetical protein